MDSKNDCNKVYDELKKSLLDSSKSRVWPNNLSSAKSNGKKINVVYKLGVNFKASYDAQFFKNKIIYSPSKSHPLKGNVIISLKSNEKGCVIDWKGEYYGANILHYLFFKIYSFLFFRRLRKSVFKIK